MPLKTKLLILLLLWLASPFLAQAQDGCIDPQQIDTSFDCPTENEPVCGCDGQEYANACIAEFVFGVTDWVASPCSEACEADFLFSHVVEDTFYLFNISSSFDSLVWTIDGTEGPSGTSGDSWLVVIPGASAEVCLTVWNNAGCTDTYCQLVYPDAPGEMCNITDCVYPGDANGDRLANIYDLGNIGYGYDLTGPERAFFPDPSNPILWAPNLCADWSDNINAVNFKHADSDGNGHINETDLQAIYENYSPDLSPQSAPTPGAPPVYLEFDTSEIVISESSPAIINFSAGIYIGTEELDVADLHSMAFFLNYPLGLTGPQGVSITYEQDPFFGPSSEVLEVKRDLADHDTGRFDMAWSRRNNGGKSGYGRVATVNFIISSDIIMGRSRPETPFTISLDGVVLTDINGDTLNYNLPENSVLPIYDQTISDQQEAEEPSSLLRAFPNPAQSTVYLDFPLGWRADRIVLFDQQGRRVLQQKHDGSKLSELDVSACPPGLYTIRALSGSAQLTKRILIKE